MRVFVSYSRLDGVFANELAQYLRDVGINVWIDTQDIEAGRKWTQAVQEGLDSCEVMSLIVSPESMASENVEDEWQYFRNQKKRIIPLLLHSAELNYQLSSLQYINFSIQQFNIAFAQLLASLGVSAPEKLIKGKRILDSLNRKYAEWLELGMDGDQLLTTKILDTIMEQLEPTLIEVNLIEYILLSCGTILWRIGDSGTISKLKRWMASGEISYFRDAMQRITTSPSIIVRKQALGLIQNLDLSFFGEWIIELLKQEDVAQVVTEALIVARNLNIVIPEALGKSLYDKHEDWLIRSLALQHQDEHHTALLVSDGTDYSTEIGDMLRMAHYTVVTLQIGLHPEFQYTLASVKNNLQLIAAYDLIVLIRGDHTSPIDIDNFYNMIKQYLDIGGVLFATPWVTWETKSTGFIDNLPFRYINFLEDELLTCHSTSHPIAKELFEEHFNYEGSYEIVTVKEGTHLLAETVSGVPIFGYRKVGKGMCFYLNACQHSCTLIPQSPLARSQGLRNSLQNVFNWISTGNYQHETQ